MSFFNEAVDWFERVQHTPFYQHLLEEFLVFLEAGSEMSVLDVGCGPGYLTRLIAQKAHSVLCVDIASKMIERAREHALSEDIQNAFYEVGSAEDIPAESGRFDLVCATSVVYLVKDPVVALREMRRVLKRGGRLAMMNPSDAMTYRNVSSFIDSQGLGRREAEVLEGWLHAAEGARRFSEEWATQVMEAAGFAQASHERHLGGLVLFSKAVHRAS